MVLLSCGPPGCWPTANDLAVTTASWIEANGACMVPGLASLPPLTLTKNVAGTQRSSNFSRRGSGFCLPGILGECERRRRRSFCQRLIIQEPRVVNRMERMHLLGNLYR